MISSRERLLRSIKHQPVDRVPINMYGYEPIDDQVKNYGGTRLHPINKRLTEYMKQYCDPIVEIYPEQKRWPSSVSEKINWETETSRYLRTICHTPNGDLTTVFRTEKYINTGIYMERLIKGIEDIDKYLSMPYEEDEDMADYFYPLKEKLGEKGLVMILVYDPIGFVEELIGMENLLYYMLAETEKIVYLLEAVHERNMNELRKVLKHDVKDILFRIAGSEVLSPPNFDPRMFYDFNGRFLKDICGAIKNAGGIPRIHSHGKVSKLLKEFVRAGAEAIDPVEPPPDGDIEFADAKRMYGRELCIFGNIEERELEHEDRDRIDQLVKKAMDSAKEGSGFILMPTAPPYFLKELPVRTEENYVQMIESAIKHGKY